MLVAYGLLTAGVVGTQLLMGEPISALWIRADAPPPSLPLDLGLGAGLGLAVTLLSQWCSQRFLWAASLDEELRPLFKGSSSLSLCGLALVTGIVEELLFRGLLQPLLGFVGASLLFGLAHPPRRRHHWPWTIAATVMGFAFGGLYLWRGNLIAPVVAHFTINHFNLHALVFDEQLLRWRSTK